MVIEKSINKKSLYCIYKIVYLLIIFSIFIIPAFAAGTPSKIEVSVNRFAVWAPYSNDLGTTGSTFTAYALVMDSNGTPVSGQSVTFKIYSAASSGTTLVSTQTATTAANGIASIFYDVSSVITSSTDADAGSWKIDSYPTSYPGVISSTNGWYSARTSSGCYSLCHKSNTGNDGDDPKSPYNDRFGQTNTRSEAAHTKSNHQSKPCTNCHVGYDAGTGTIHNTQTCINCHDDYPSDGIPLMPGCYDCHPNNNNKLLSINTLGTVSGFTGVSIFSWNLNAPEVAHTSSGNSLTQGVPCVSCHGPAHNISKPVLSGTSNSYTEDSQCANCHVSKGKHSNGNPVYCTACHSQDAHAIGVINKNSGTQPAFVSLGTTNAMTKDDCLQCHASGPESTYFAGLSGMSGYGYTTNFAPATPVHNRHNGTVACTVCHDNTNFHDIKFLQPNGAHSTSKTTAVKCIDCHDGTNSAVRSVVQTRFGSLPPTVNANMNHSSDNGGQKWGNYWTTPNDACLYCHGETQHNTSAIGAAGSALGTDKVGDPIGSGTVCSSCHNQDDSNYNVVNSLSPKPPANKAGSNYPSSGAVDHSSFGITDNDCKNCHGSNLAGGENMVGFTHNVAPGGGGGSCTSCHAQPPDGASRYNTQGAHTLHSVAGYGDIPETSCNYCHSTEGVNEAGHPGSFNDASVAPNSSATIALYTPNILNGQDDTCAGVSCHTTGLSNGAKVGTATWDSTTAGACNECHSTVPSGLPPTGNHTKHYTIESYQCATCHGTNADGGTQTGHKTNGAIDISFTGTLATGGSITTGTCTVYCHSPNPNDVKPKPTWNTSTVVCGDCHSLPPTTTRNGVAHTTNTNCDVCHGTGASTGTQLGHIDGSITTLGGGTTCTICHAQPPNDAIVTDQRNNTDGAHTLHKNKGYGAVAETSCNYCHNNGGNNEGGAHPNGLYNVVTNSSATIALYTPNILNGQDDTCAGVSCHTTGLSNGAKVGTATWDSTTAGACNECHSTVPSGLPPTGNHTKHYTIESYQCATCHGTNADGGTQTGHKTNGAIDISFTGTLATGGSITTGTCTVYCHSPNPNDVKPKPTWNTSTVVCGDCHSLPPTTTRNGVAHTTNTNCDVCHGTGAATGTQLGHIDGSITTLGGGTTCTICHAQPPNDAIVTDQRNNTDGAHTLHKNKGYGAVAETSCNYCHNNGGNNEGGAHPNGLYNVVTNSSATIALYTPNILNGKDDTCAGVSCHTTGLSNGAKVGTATWDSTTAGACNECHSTVPSGLPPTGNHTKHYTIESYQCATCHGTNADGGTQTGHKTNGAIDISFTGTLATGGSITTGTCTVYCHSPNPNDVKPKPTWNTSTVVCGDCHSLPPTTTRNGVAHTTNTNCDVCHGTGASTGTQLGHIDGSITTLGGGTTCTICHAQPPNDAIVTDQRNNTDGAHTLHKNKGYGAVAETSCNYCHNNGGNNEGGAHPNGLYNVVTNSSATIALYTPNILNGQDDTCAGVSCHTTGLSNGAKVGTATWDSTTAGACNECHSTVPSGLPPTGNHTKHYTIESYQCATCHGTNADGGTQTGHKTNGAIDISFTGTLATGGSITTGTCTVYCHSPNPNDVKPKPTWNTSTVVCGDCHSLPPTTTRNGATPHAGVTDCDVCHGTGANTGTQNGHINRIIDVSGGGCTGCHSNVGTASLGLHSNLNGTSAVDDGDCQTCHFASFPMVTGAANSSNTHYCQDCHTSAGTGSPKPGSLVSVSHGKIDCKWCHAAGDQPASKYHSNNLGSQQGPKGTATGANCATCHGANLQDIFRAPGITHLGDITTCGECHSGANNHLVSALSDFSSPTLSGIPLTTSVTVGAPAQIQATVSDNIVMIAAAQYQVTNTSGTVIPWTNMTSLDGFNSATETVIASIPTSNLIGPYTVSIKGMSSAYKTDPSKPYYPLNGMWSSVSTVQLIVTQPKGYVNGTVKNGTNTIAGAIITTNTGVSAITDSNGNYSLNLAYGPYQLIATKEPEYYFNNSVSVEVSEIPVYQNIILNKKPMGTISGTVKNK